MEIDWVTSKGNDGMFHTVVFYTNSSIRFLRVVALDFCVVLKRGVPIMIITLWLVQIKEVGN